MRVTLAEALARLSSTGGPRFATVLERETFTVEVYAPRGTDPQKPHTRDELYVVIAGSGWFVNGTERHRFGAGDLMFVPSGVSHRFEEFDDDLVIWAVFFGPEK